MAVRTALRIICGRILLGAAGMLAAGAATAAPVETISLADSFRIGTTGNSVCTAQIMPAGAALSDMFDRGYSILCRDASVPVGQLYALRLRGGDPATRLARLSTSLDSLPIEPHSDKRRFAHAPA